MLLHSETPPWYSLDVCFAHNKLSRCVWTDHTGELGLWPESEISRRCDPDQNMGQWSEQHGRTRGQIDPQSRAPSGAGPQHKKLDQTHTAQARA
jgi:hypothetical protein